MLFALKKLNILKCQEIHFGMFLKLENFNKKILKKYRMNIICNIT